MKKSRLIILLALGCALTLDAATKPFPAHWGEPPKVQTRDLRELPGGYGTGSSTLAKWIQQNMDKDRQEGRLPAETPPAVKNPDPKTAPAKNPPPRTPPAAPPTDKQPSVNPPATPPPAPAPPPKERPERKPPEQEKPKQPEGDGKMTPKEKKAIDDYVKKQTKATGKGKGKGKNKDNKSLPPGLAKKVENGGELPPGWQDKLAVGETMPEKVLQEAQPVPKEVKMPPPPKGTTNVVLEGKVIRVMEKTRQILDVLDLNK